MKAQNIIMVKKGHKKLYAENVIASHSANGIIFATMEDWNYFKSITSYRDEDAANCLENGLVPNQVYVADDNLVLEDI